MRGKEFANIGEQAVKGITPACAGKRRWNFRTTRVRGDHPRVCGEKFVVLAHEVFKVGSPPRVRGKETVVAFEPCSSEDHPRVCGEKRQNVDTGSIAKGSPPRVRGKDAEPHAERNPDGITPGEKTKKIPEHRPFQLHPVPVSFSFA